MSGDGSCGTARCEAVKWWRGSASGTEVALQFGEGEVKWRPVRREEAQAMARFGIGRCKW